MMCQVGFRVDVPRHLVVVKPFCRWEEGIHLCEETVSECHWAGPPRCWRHRCRLSVSKSR